MDELTDAVRAGSLERVRALAEETLPVGLQDERDLMWGLAPILVAVKRLGVDHAVFFDDLASAGPPEVAELVRSFARRRDVTPEAFGFRVRDEPEGPRFVMAL